MRRGGRSVHCVSLDVCVRSVEFEWIAGGGWSGVCGGVTGYICEMLCGCRFP